MSHRDPKSITIAIVGGDQLVGYTLELMLRSAGFQAQFLNESSINGPSEPFEKVSLVLLAPRTSGAERKVFLEHLRNSMSDKVAVPVLELVSSSNKAQAKEEVGARRVLWPCQLKVLKREIEAALLNHSS